jgi:hypothetical protein
MSNQEKKSKISTPTRILALVLSILVGGSALTGIIYMLVNLFA